MKIKFYTAIVFLLCIISAKSQQSMIDDVSYPMLEKMIAAAKTNYPAVKIYDHKINIAQNGIKKAKLSWFDIFSFSYLYNPKNNPSTVSPNYLTTYQVGFFVNIGSLLQKPAIIKQAKEELEIARLDSAQYQITLETMVKERYFVYVKQLTALKLRAQSVTDAESVAKEVKYKYEKGEETFENYNKALLVSAEQIQSKIEAEAFLLIAKSNLEELIGKKLEDIK